MILTRRSPVPSFFTVTDWGGDVPPTATLPKSSEVGVTVMSGACPPLVPPVPLSATFTGFSLASGSFEGIESTDDFCPIEVGLKNTDTVHDWPGGNIVLEHPSTLFLNIRLPRVIPLTRRLAVPSFLMVIVLGADILP